MQKIRLLVFGLLAGMMASSAYVQEINLPEGFTVAGSSGAYKLVLTPYATYPLIYEEVVPEVSSETVKYAERIILEGKAGTGPGEFGTSWDSTYMGEDGPMGILSPGPAVENSKGEIYVLDVVNNRIQKFTRDGRYILSISVPSRADKNGKSVIRRLYPEKVYPYDFMGTHAFEDIEEPYYVGIGIAFDAQDRLYYYVGKQDISGEVWVFKNDKLKKKIQGKDIPAKGSGIRIMDNRPFIVSGDLFDLGTRKTIPLEEAWRSRKEGDLKAIIPKDSIHEIHCIRGDRFKKVIIPVKNDHRLMDDFVRFGMLPNKTIFFTAYSGDGYEKEVYFMNSSCSKITKAEGNISPDRTLMFRFGTLILYKYELK